MVRIIIKNKEDRTLLFTELSRNMNFKTWKEVAKFLKISRSMLGRYRTGSLTLPSRIFNKIIKAVPLETKVYFSKKILIKPDNWGQVKGGKTTYKNYKYIFERGRKIGLQKLLNRGPKYKFDINVPLSEDLCEFLGAFIGDGFTNKYGSSYIIQFTGHRTLDREYYYSFIIPFAQSFFGIKPHIFEEENTVRVSFYSKLLFELLTKRFKFPAGKKSKIIRIPDELLISKSFIAATLRGIFDTDGSIYFDKRSAYKSPYPKIEFHMHNTKILNQIKIYLEEFNLKVFLSKDRKVYLCGIDSLKLFISTIGIINSNHLTRIKRYYPNILKLNCKPGPGSSVGWSD